jgi:group I intron endonuclease
MEPVETEELRKYCVYLITCLVSSKQYAGFTFRTLQERWNQHCKDAKKLKRRICSAIRKYGPEAFSIVELRSGLTRKEASDEEILTIKTLYLTDPEFGYNMTDGGQGGRQTEEVREKMGRPGTPCCWKGREDEKEVVHKIWTSRGLVPDPLCGGKYRDPKLPTEEICREYESGKSTQQIADKYGVSDHTVYRRLVDSGIKIRNRKQVMELIGKQYGFPGLTTPLTEETRKKLRDNNKKTRRDVATSDVLFLWNQGWSKAKIGRHFKMSAYGISQRIKAAKNDSGRPK